MLFEDFNQFKSIDNYDDHCNNQTFRSIFNYNEMKIQFKPETSRFYQKTYNIITEILNIKSIKPINTTDQIDLS